MFRPTRRAEGAHRDGIWSVRWSKNLIFTGALDGCAKVWSDDLRLLGSTPEQKLGITSVIAFSDNNECVSASQDSIIKVYEVPDMKEKYVIDPGLLQAWTISVSPQNNFFASGSKDGVVNIWNAVDGVKVGSITVTPEKFILAVCCSPDGSKVACSNIDGTIGVIDVESKQVLWTCSAHALATRSVVFSPDGGLLYSASDDRHVCIYDAITGSVVNSFSHGGMCFCVDASPDLRHFIVGCADHSVATWDIGMQRQQHSFDSQHTDQVWGVSYDPTGKRFVSVGDDALIQMYEAN